MTTRVTIDTHAGRAVLVTTATGRSLSTPSGKSVLVNYEIIEPFTTRDFYIHSDLHIINIEELSQ